MRAYISSLSFKKQVARSSVNGNGYEKRVPTAPGSEVLNFQGFVARDAGERGRWIHEEQHLEPKSWIKADS
jgi:hypothetical protein